MESYLQDKIDVRWKHSSPGALERLRSLRGLVDNPKRRFRFTAANLSKPQEADAVRGTNQGDNIEAAAYAEQGSLNLQETGVRQESARPRQSVDPESHCVPIGRQNYITEKFSSTEYHNIVLILVPFLAAFMGIYAIGRTNLFNTHSPNMAVCITSLILYGIAYLAHKKFGTQSFSPLFPSVPLIFASLYVASALSILFGNRIFIVWAICLPVIMFCSIEDAKKWLVQVFQKVKAMLQGINYDWIGGEFWCSGSNDCQCRSPQRCFIVNLSRFLSVNGPIDEIQRQ